MKKDEISIEITKEASVRMLHDDRVDLTDMGPLEVCRASHIEFNNTLQLWIVTSAKTGKVLTSAMTRAEALEFERRYYSPGGLGWSELTEGKEGS